jgi:ABC-type dipeptide/oligopeptide/nickel transport system permease component
MMAERKDDAFNTLARGLGTLILALPLWIVGIFVVFEGGLWLINLLGVKPQACGMTVPPSCSSSGDWSILLWVLVPFLILMLLGCASLLWARRSPR